MDRAHLGGHCLHEGTIPSKTLREAAIAADTVSPETLQIVMRRKNAVIQAEMEVIERQLTRNSVEYIAGKAQLMAWYEVAIENESGTHTVEGDFIIIATGTSPARCPSEIPFDEQTIFDSDSILNLTQSPKKLAVLGAGVIGCEYASIFARIGAEVHLINKYDQMLKGIDAEIVDAIQRHFVKSGIKMRLGVEFGNIHRHDCACGSVKAAITLNGKEELFDAVLVCLGRIGNVKDLNLAAANLKSDERGIIKVNSHYQTTVPHIYAVGDVIGPPALAAASAEQGRLASAHAFGLKGGSFPGSFPYGVYTIPEISWVGKHEEDLKKEGIPYVVGRALYKELARGKILDDEHGFLKLIVHQETRRLLGVHVLGTGATELIHIGQVAMDLGASIEFFVNNVFNYPTLAEAYKVAAYNAYNQLLMPVAAPKIAVGQ